MSAEETHKSWNLIDGSFTIFCASVLCWVFEGRGGRRNARCSISGIKYYLWNPADQGEELLYNVFSISFFRAMDTSGAKLCSDQCALQDGLSLVNNPRQEKYL